MHFVSLDRFHRKEGFFRPIELEQRSDVDECNRAVVVGHDASRGILRNSYVNTRK